MDDYYLMNPQELLQGAVADIILDLENPLILEVSIYSPMTVQTLMVPVGAFTMCWGRDAYNVGGRTVFWPYNEGDMRDPPDKRRGRLVRTTTPTSFS